MRQTKPNPNGFNTTDTDGIGFVLGATIDTTYFLFIPIDITTYGYAVVVGKHGSPDAIRLVRIEGTIDNASLKDIIVGGNYSNEFLSVKVTFNPANNEWKLFVESGADNFPHPDNPSLTNALAGTAIDATYTNRDLKYLGMDWHHDPSPTDSATFDDVYIPGKFISTPVSLLSFTGHRTGNSIQLDWKTTDEINNVGFEVQRSANLPDFVPIGYVPAVEKPQSVNTYVFTDENDRQGSYYRLKQLDQNGEYEYSKTIYVKDNSSVALRGLLLYPVPTEGNIHLSFPDVTEARLTLVSVHGTVLADFTALPPEADDYLSKQLSKLPAGVYVLHTTQGNQTYRNQLVKH